MLTLILALGSAHATACPTGVSAVATCGDVISGALFDDADVGASTFTFATYNPCGFSGFVTNQDIVALTCPDDGALHLDAVDHSGCNTGLFLLDATCTADGGCFGGSLDGDLTAPLACLPGELLYLVLEHNGFVCPVPPGPLPWTVSLGCEEACSGGVDEDLDGATDCADDDCTSAPACVPSPLTFLGPDPGAAGVRNDLGFSGATPGATVYLLASTQTGSTPVPGCGGSTVGLRSPTVVAALTAGSGGAGSTRIRIPASLAGRTAHFAAVELSACSVSPIVSIGL